MDLLEKFIQLERDVLTVTGAIDVRRPTTTGLVQLSRVSFIEAAGRKRVQYVLVDGSTRDGPGYLKELERCLERCPAFVRTSNDHLVNLDRVVRIARDPARRGYFLSFEGSDRQALVSNLQDPDGCQPYVDAVTEYLGLATLDHVTPFNDEARALRELEIGSFLDHPGDDLRFKPVEFFKPHFSDSTGAIVLRKLVRNMVWQNYVWIRDGKRPPFEGLIRSFWYSHVKPVYGRLGLLDPAKDQASVVNDVLAEMVVTYCLFHYWDMGFFDDGASYRKIGPRFPGVILFTEKEGLFPVVDRAHLQWGVSVIALGGSPNRISTDYLVHELGKVFDLRRMPVHLFGYTDYDPAGTYRIAEAFRRQLQQVGVKVATLYQITQPANLSPQELDLYKVPLHPTAADGKTLLRRWKREGYGVVVPGDSTTYGVVADSMEPVRVREIFRREAAPVMQ
jgi:hypothetical protein